jgi:hypothetical protein
MTSHSTNRRDALLPNDYHSATMHRAGLVLAAAGLLACGGETANSGDTTATAATPSVSATAPANACELLPASEVTTILGETVRDSVALALPGGGAATTLSQCNYASATNAAAVSLMLRRNAPGETATQGMKGARETMAQSGVTVEDVPGLGEAAFWGGNQLHVFTNNGWYLVASPSRSGGLAQARALAEKAMSRL